VIAIDQIQQCHGLSAQGVDHVVIAHDVPVLSVVAGATTLQAHQLRTADEQLQPIIKQSNTQSMANEPGGGGIEHLAQGEAS
jgi:hypothetical protein